MKIRLASVVNHTPSYLKKSSFLQVVYRRAREIGAYINLFTHKSNMPVTKFVIFAQGRTGSTLLVDLINSHPGIHCDDEILKRKVLFPGLFIRARSALSEKDVYGFKVKIYQLWDQKVRDSKQFISDLYEHGWKIIYLTRRNIFRQTISGFVVEQSKVWHHNSIYGPLKLKEIYIDCDELLKRMKEREMFLAHEKEVLEGVPHITINYENDLLRAQYRQDTLDKIFNYLDVPFVQVKTKLVRITSDNLSAFVQNYEEVERVIGNTEYAQFLAVDCKNLMVQRDDGL